MKHHYDTEFPKFANFDKKRITVFNGFGGFTRYTNLRHQRPYYLEEAV